MAITNKARLTSNILNKAGEKVSVSAESNIKVVSLVNTDIVVTKTATPNYALPLGVVTVTTNIANNTDFDIEDITVNDVLSSDATFVQGTVKVGSQTYDDLDPTQGMTLPVTLGSNVDIDITYDLKVNEYPETDAFTNKSTISVTIDGQNFNIDSNEISVDILNNGVALLKSASASAVKSGDTLVYTVEITNSGPFENTDLVFTDPIPDGTEFIEGSVKIDGTQQPTYNPANGFSLNNLGINETQKIEFSVLIK